MKAFKNTAYSNSKDIPLNTKTLIMVKSLIQLIIIICLIYLWVLNPIPFVLFEDTLQNQNQSISQSQQIMSIRSGAFDPLQQRAKDLTTLGGSKKSDSGGEAPKPKKDVSPDNLSPGKERIKYKPSPGSGDGGSGNYNVDFPKDVDPDKSISDPGFWNTLEPFSDQHYLFYTTSTIQSRGKTIKIF